LQRNTRKWDAVKKYAGPSPDNYRGQQMRPMASGDASMHVMNGPLPVFGARWIADHPDHVDRLEDGVHTALSVFPVTGFWVAMGELSTGSHMAFREETQRPLTGGEIAVGLLAVTAPVWGGPVGSLVGKAVGKVVEKAAHVVDNLANAAKPVIDDALRTADNVAAPVRGATQLDEAFHYTSSQWGDVIKRQGLRPGSYATPAGELRSLQAKLELALPPTRSAPDIRIRIDLDGLRKAGYEIPTPSRISSTVVGPDGRVYQMPGGGWEMQFPYEIPGEFLEIIPIR
jgi:hypothetical protein